MTRAASVTSTNFMGPFSLHAVMAMALKVPASRLRRKAPRDSGGSFGVRQAGVSYAVLMCLASRKAGAPVMMGGRPARASRRRHLRHRAAVHAGSRGEGRWPHRGACPAGQVGRTAAATCARRSPPPSTACTAV
ncbi:molybdopterin cofactor-binding domain-containing protein [Cupriavidus basilensis]